MVMRTDCPDLTVHVDWHVKLGVKQNQTRFGLYIGAHKEPSHLVFHCLQMCVRIYLISEFTRLYPNAYLDEAIVSMDLPARSTDLNLI